MDNEELKVGDWVRVRQSHLMKLNGMLGQIEEYDDDAFGKFVSVTIDTGNSLLGSMSYLFEPNDLEIPTEEEVALWILKN